MFRTSYVHHQEDYIVHAALHGIKHIHQPAKLHPKMHLKHTIKKLPIQ